MDSLKMPTFHPHGVLPICLTLALSTMPSHVALLLCMLVSMKQPDLKGTWDQAWLSLLFATLMKILG